MGNVNLDKDAILVMIYKEDVKEKKTMDGVSMEKSVFRDTLGSMRQNMQAQNEEVKWKVEIDKDINKDINKEGLSII